MSRLHLTTMVALILAIATPALAGGVDVTPEIAYYDPLSDQASVEGIGSASHAASMGWGGRLTFWLNDNFALEATGMFTSTDMQAQLFGQQVGELGATVFFGTGRAVVGFGSKARFLLNAGLGFQSSSYDYIEGGTWMIGVVGAGLSIPLGQTLGMRVGVDDYMYNAQWDLGDGVLTDAIFQNDVTFTVGLSFLTGRQ
jgi:hypothetical protein